jgi:hypothetical protein
MPSPRALSPLEEAFAPPNEDELLLDPLGIRLRPCWRNGEPDEEEEDTGGEA